MLDNALVLAGIAAAALVVAVCFWGGKKHSGDFGGWWNASGFPIWMMAAVILALIALAKGCFH